MSLKVSTALILRKLRKERGISQETLAKISGIDRTFISGVERCRRNVTLDTLERFLAALEVETPVFLVLLAEQESVRENL
ncbi:helix-turn-helix domain-containing protein [Photobacterium nomapromontoriensis]|uniref:helix-turn-helix domain-containing protein n=1 Tax=Photobacterium nomapromontoriensis TaxID=2910237 RepID=UPI003D0EF7C0